MTKDTTLRHYLAESKTVIKDQTVPFGEFEAAWRRGLTEHWPLEAMSGLLHGIFYNAMPLDEIRQAIRFLTKLADGHNCERYFLAEGEVLRKWDDPKGTDDYHDNLRLLARRAWKELHNNVLVVRGNNRRLNYTLPQLYDFSDGLEPNTVAEDLLTLFDPFPPFMF